MVKKTGKLFVISLGGSLIIPGDVDIKFLNNFKRLILASTKKSNRFIIITGGGRLSRQYQTALKNLAKVSPKELDWIGIYTTRLNARLVQMMLGNKLTHPTIVEDPNRRVNFREKVLIAAGWI